MLAIAAKIEAFCVGAGIAPRIDARAIGMGWPHCGVFPFRFRGQAHRCPLAKGLGVVPIDMGDGVMLVAAGYRPCVPMGRGGVACGLHKGAIFGVGDGRLSKAKCSEFYRVLGHFARQDGVRSWGRVAT